MPTRIRIPTSTPTPITHLRRRRALTPIRHAIRLIPIPPIAPLPHIPHRIVIRLLRPDSMTLRVRPGTRRGIAGAETLLVV